MTHEQATLAVIDALSVCQIPYMVVGSLSSSYYGIARSTKDADFVLEMGDQSIRTLLERLGPLFHLDPQMSFESVTGTLRHIVEVKASRFKIEFFRLSDDPHDQERFRRRCRAKLFDREVFLPTAEDVIVTKLRWALGAKRNKDWDDIRNVIAVQGDRIDWDHVYSWCDQHGTRELVDEIRRSIPTL
jgi:hypothetical protein